MGNQKSKIAQDLLRIGAVALRPNDPFTWASGRRSPVYCDNRLTLGYPDIRTRIADGFTAHVAAMDRGTDVIAGTATAGIPHAALVADRLGLPMAYVRAKPKAHGKENLIEG
ncbi:MAG: orotate phosphoribosyltransferase, partial [Bacteroidota bacterium]